MYKKWLNGKKVVCFDLDGTIVDTLGPAVQAFDNILHLANPELSLRYVYGRFGETTYEKWARLADQKLIKNNMSVKDLTEGTQTEFLKIISTMPLEPRPGFWDLVYRLRENHGLQIALTTNTGRSVAMQVLNKIEAADVFDFMIFGDEVKKPKPDPEIYIKTAQQLQVKPNEMLVFEDSLVGVTSAYKAGASVFVIWDTKTDKSLFPKEVLAFSPDFEGIGKSLEYTMEEELEGFKDAFGVQDVAPPVQSPKVK